MPDKKIICFQQDTKERKGWFKKASFSHPAKMHLSLQIYLIEHYTKPGDTILDPMAGSGTILTACALGRNVICVELEKKYVDMQKANWQKIQSLGPMMFCKMGEATILQGEARNLDGLLTDNILFSPPYARAEAQISADKFADPEKFAKVSSKRFKEGKKKGHFATKEAILRSMKKREKGYSDNPSNISNLPYGEISAVISSPPYAEAQGRDEHKYSDGRVAEMMKRSYLKSKQGKSKGQIANLKYGDVDAVITSPPFGEAHNQKGLGVGDNDRKDLRDYSYLKTETKGQIGNLKSENYLQAMLQVYQECHKVLKDKGLMVLVVKNFIRDKKIIRLDLDTIKICEKAGFVLIERLKRKLTSQSFWRIIYHKKYPDVEKIEFEDILVFQRAAA